MLQIRLIRTFTPAGMPEKTFDKPLDSAGTFASHAEMFAKLAGIVDRIPMNERYNVYYTLGETNGTKERKWFGQEVIPFDIDYIVDENGHFDQKAYIDAVFPVLGVDPDKCIIVASGNGLQILVQVKYKIEAEDYFRVNKKAYSQICCDIADALRAAGLKFKDVDTASFAPNRMFRLPDTLNKKPHATRPVRLLNGHIEPQDFPKLKKVAAKKAAVGEESEAQEVELTFAIDTPAVEAGCEFLKWMKASPQDVQEPQWYAGLTVLARLENGKEKAHEYSSGHAGYTVQETDRKIEQSLQSPGPRTCANIDSIWGGCAKCPNFKKVSSPVCIKSEKFIASRMFGFYKIDKKGRLEPQYEDLRKYFEEVFKYKVNRETELVHVWNGKKYEPFSKTQLRSFAHEQFTPKPTEHMVQEFINHVTRTNHEPNVWFSKSTEGFLNFDNGVLDLKTDELLPHDPSRGFLYMLPYPFDPTATAPFYEKFAREVFCGDESAKKLNEEFIGDTLCDKTYWLQKFLMYVGEGSNGKSAMQNLIAMVLGEDNTTNFSPDELDTELARSQLPGKLANLCEELPSNYLKSTGNLKKMMGGKISGRGHYRAHEFFRNTTRLIFSTNELPAVSDRSDGFFRRVELLMFRAKFVWHKSKVNPEKHIYLADSQVTEKLRSELSGICNIMLAAYKRLRAQGHLTRSDDSATELQNYRDTQDRGGSWIKENLVWVSDWDTAAPALKLEEIYVRFVNDCKASEEKPLTKRIFIECLRRHVPDYKERFKRPTSGDRSKQVLYGVTFYGAAGGVLQPTPDPF